MVDAEAQLERNHKLFSVEISDLVLEPEHLAAATCAGPVPFSMLGVFESSLQSNASLSVPLVPLSPGGDVGWCENVHAGQMVIYWCRMDYRRPRPTIRCVCKGPRKDTLEQP